MNPKDEVKRVVDTDAKWMFFSIDGANINSITSEGLGLIDIIGMTEITKAVNINHMFQASTIKPIVSESVKPDNVSPIFPSTLK